MIQETALNSPMIARSERLTEAEFEQFYEQTIPGLWRYISQFVGDAELARDIVQAAFIRLWEHPPRREHEQKLKAYLYRIATNLAYDEFRKQKRKRRLLERLRRSSVTKTETFPNQHEPLHRALKMLSPRDRALLWLAYFEGYTYEEVARILNLKTKSLGVMLYRARKRFEHCLRQCGYNPEHPQKPHRGSE